MGCPLFVTGEPSVARETVEGFPLFKAASPERVARAPLHSGVMPAAFATFCHFSVSDLM